MSATGPKVLAVLHGFIPSAMITVVKPLVELHRAGRIQARITLESLATPRDVRRADLVVFCRNMEPKYAALLDAAQSCRVPILYDLDDDLFEVPPDCDVAPYCRTPERQAMLAAYLRAASLVRVYSKTLEARVAALSPRVERTFAPIDVSQVVEPGNRSPVPPEEPVAIVYATSRVRDELSRIFLPALLRLLAACPGRVKAHFWGHKPVPFPPGASYHRCIYQYDRFLRRFSRSGFQIGLAPLPDDAFYRSKTNNKFREYGACGIAGIYSDVDVYSDCVTDGQTGLLVENDPNRWYEAMLRLVEDPALRAAIQRQAHAHVCEHYSQEKFAGVFWKQIEGLLGSRPGGSPLAAPQRARHSPAGNLAARGATAARHALGYLRRRGLRQTCRALGWALSDRWMLLRLRQQLARPAAGVRAWPWQHRQRARPCP
jgi:glycosyltransferase involved in cell wall biosynthesis